MDNKFNMELQYNTSYQSYWLKASIFFIEEVNQMGNLSKFKKEIFHEQLNKIAIFITPKFT